MTAGGPASLIGQRGGPAGAALDQQPDRQADFADHGGVSRIAEIAPPYPSSSRLARLLTP